MQGDAGGTETRTALVLAEGDDAKLAAELDALRLPGEPVAVAVRALAPPQRNEAADWGAAQAALATAHVVVVVLSPAFLASGFMGTVAHPLRDELARVEARGAAVLLVLGDDCPHADWLAFDLVNGRFFPPLAAQRAVVRASFLAMLRNEVVAAAEGTTLPTESARAARLEEFRLVLASTQHLADRRQDAAQVYLAVNAGLAAVLGFLAKDLAMQGGTLVLATAPLFAAGAGACVVWRRVIRRYERLIDWRYRQLRRMERAAASDGYRLVNREWAVLYRPKAGRGLSGLEVWIPWLFAALYGLGFALTLLLALRHWAPPR